MRFLLRFFFKSACLALLTLTLCSCQMQQSDEQRRSKAIDLVNKADAYRAQKEYFQARDLYYKSVDWYPLPKAYYGLGSCELAADQYGRAAYFFNQALAAAPNNKQFSALAQYASARSKGLAATMPSLEAEPVRIAEAGNEQKAMAEEMERKLAMAEPRKGELTVFEPAGIVPPKPEPPKPIPPKPEPPKPLPPKPEPKIMEPVKPAPAKVVAVAPEPVKPAPIKSEPVKVTPRPEPVRPTPRPEPIKPEPVKPEPIKVTPKPEPVKVTPKPGPIKPEPAKVTPRPEPVKVTPKPEPIKPEPVKVTPKPELVKPEPSAPEPVKPEPSKPVPTAFFPEPPTVAESNTPENKDTAMARPKPPTLDEAFPTPPKPKEQPTPAPKKIEPKPTPPPPSTKELANALFKPDATGEDEGRPAKPTTRTDKLLDSPDFYIQSAKSLEDRGMLPEAYQEYLQARYLDPKNVDIHLKIVSLLLKMGREERASNELARLRAKFPQSPEVLLHSGNFHLNRKEYSQAAEYYKQAVKLAPDFSKGYNNLGVVYMNMGQYKLAADAFNQTLSLDPDNKSAHLNLGLIFDSHLPDPIRARYHYRRYLALGGERAEEVKQWLAQLPPAISNK